MLAVHALSECISEMCVCGAFHSSGNNPSCVTVKPDGKRSPLHFHFLPTFTYVFHTYKNAAFLQTLVRRRHAINLSQGLDRKGHVKLLKSKLRTTYYWCHVHFASSPFIIWFNTAPSTLLLHLSWVSDRKKKTQMSISKSILVLYFTFKYLLLTYMRILSLYPEGCENVSFPFCNLRCTRTYIKNNICFAFNSWFISV